MSILDIVLGRTRVQVRENERLIILANGRIHALLGPGKHVVRIRSRDLEISRHDIGSGVFHSVLERPLFRKMPDIASQEFTTFRTGENEVSLIERDGVIFSVMTPNQKLVVWNDAGPWNQTRHDVSDDLSIDSVVMMRLNRARRSDAIISFTIDDGEAGLVYADGVQIKTLPVGTHAFWNVGPQLSLKTIDMRLRPVEISSRELLTGDGITVIVDLVAEYRCIDPALMVSQVKDAGEAVGRALRSALNTSIGNLGGADLLQRKAETALALRDSARLATRAFGVELDSVAISNVAVLRGAAEIPVRFTAAGWQAAQ